MPATSTKTALAGLFLAVCLGACSSSGEAPALTLPSLPSIGSIGSIGGSANEAPVGSATELYSRIAKGAMGCWFGASGYLKKDYIYGASADAPSRGGKAEIIVHVRDPALPNPRGAKAYKVNIEPTSETTAMVKTENIKMPEAVAVTMTADVNRWSRGDQGCAGASTAAGWAPAPADAAKPAATKASKTAHKSKTAATP